MKLTLLLAVPLFVASSFAQNVCVELDPGRRVGTLASSSMREISGIAASRLNLGVLWAHNDSGDTARAFAIATDGTLLGTFALSGASSVDWEDMAIGPGPILGQDYLFFADTGNNALNRTTVTVYRVAEPNLAGFPKPVQTSLTGVEAFPMRYPSGAKHDAETFLVDPQSGDFFIVTRDRSHTGTTYIFLNPAPQSPGVQVTLQLVATLSTVEITGGDVSASGNSVALRTQSLTEPGVALLWPRPSGHALEEVFTSTPCTFPLVAEPQGEAIGFAPDGKGFYTTSEGTSQPIYYYGPLTAPTAPNNLVAPTISSTEITLSWSDRADNESGFLVERSNNGTAFTQAAFLPANSNSYKQSGLTAGTAYWFRVSAYNNAGWSPNAGPLKVTTSSVSVSVPSAPRNLTATAVSRSQITLRWTDGSNNETGFKIERSTDNISFTQIGTAGANSTSFQSTGLTSNRIYFFRVRATNSAGNSSYSNTASARTQR